jgi:hypothetical protein
MLVPLLCERVRVKDCPEIFQVVAFDLTARRADLIRLGTDIIERGVPWAILEGQGDDGERLTPGSSGELAHQACFWSRLISYALICPEKAHHCAKHSGSSCKPC